MKYRFYLDMAIQYLIISIFYPSIEAYAMAHRMSSVHGGEVLLWAVPLFILFVRWTKVYEKKRIHKEK